MSRNTMRDWTENSRINGVSIRINAERLRLESMIYFTVIL